MQIKYIDVNYSSPSANITVSNVVAQSTSKTIVAETAQTRLDAEVNPDLVVVNAPNIGSSYIAIAGLYRRQSSTVAPVSQLLFSVGYLRSVQEQFSTSERILKTVSKLLNNSNQPIVTIRFANSKLLKDSQPVNSSALKTIAKPQSSSFTYTDLVNIGGGKLFKQNITSISNYIVLYTKLLQQYVIPTDDVFGDANIDDDQTAWVGKNTISSIITNFKILLNANKQLNTSTNIDQNTIISQQKLLKSTYTNQDKVLLQNSKYLSSTSLSTTNFQRIVSYLRDTNSSFSSNSQILNSPVLSRISQSTSASSNIKLITTLYKDNTNTTVLVLLNTNKLFSSQSAPNSSTTITTEFNKQYSSQVLATSSFSLAGIQPIITSTISIFSKQLLQTSKLFKDQSTNSSKALLTSALYKQSLPVANAFSLFKQADTVKSSATSGQDYIAGYFANYFEDITYTEDITYVGTEYIL